MTTRPRARAGRPTRGEAKSITRQAIVQTALALFAENGIEATSLDEIAAQVGLTKGAVYASFGSKRELVDAVMQLVTLPADVAMLGRKDLSLEERLRLYARWLVSLGRTERKAVLLDLEYYALALRDKRWAQQIRGRFRLFAAEIASLLQEAALERREASAIAPVHLASILIALSRGIIQELVRDRNAVAPEAIESAFALLGKGE